MCDITVFKDIPRLKSTHGWAGDSRILDLRVFSSKARVRHPHFSIMSVCSWMDDMMSMAGFDLHPLLRLKKSQERRLRDVTLRWSELAERDWIVMCSLWLVTCPFTQVWSRWKGIQQVFISVLFSFVGKQNNKRKAFACLVLMQKLVCVYVAVSG